MKKIINSMIGGCILFISCTDASLETSLSEYEIQTQAIEMIEQGYIAFTDNQYQMNLEIHEAINLGYSSMSYNRLLAALEEANHTISTLLIEWQDNPNISEIRISDATYESRHMNEIGYITKSATIYGEIETYDNSPQERTYILPPVQASYIIANCFARNHPFGVNIVTTIQGTIVECKTTMLSNDIQVAIYYTNANLTVRYQTTCSGGGKCTWKLAIPNSEIYLP